MNVLLVYPLCPDSFWSFKHALKFVSKKAAVPPLGLLTVSAMLPPGWQKKLVDLNISALLTSDIQWADYVFISAMYIQRESVDKVITECKKWNKKIVAGGPLFTQDYEYYPQIDHFILNEAEITMPLFLKDLAEGEPKLIYMTSEYADISLSPVPDYHLLAMKNYAMLNLQVSRGCPYSCDFCEITALLGRKVRMKETLQVISELDMLYNLHWHGPVSIVDDNFIGNKKVVKNDLLPAMKEWMQIHKYPFVFTCQSSINLADDAELMSLMVETGFDSAFIGIETPEEIALHNCNKEQNKNRDLLQNVKKIQRAGLQVSVGFIVGFDSDTPSIFQRQIDFIQQSGIVSAMVGLLNAPKNTKLYAQMESENRLTTDATGDNTDSSMNFIPKMNYNDLIAGHKRIIQNIYATKPYYKRLRQLLRNFKPQPKSRAKIDLSLLFAFLKSVFVIGFMNKGRGDYWKLIIWTLFNRPGSIIEAVTHTVYGYHFRTIYGLRNRK
jgi:radical SAM superfamily enzyme YgiQ (UPF0313 family)